MIRVCVGAISSTHPVDLARELDRRGHLTRFFTGLPRRRVRGIDKQRIASNPLLLAPAVALRRLTNGGHSPRLDVALTEAFARWMARRLPACDVCHALSSYGVEVHESGRQRWGARTVCDHGSAHIQVQTRLLEEEARRWGAPFAGPHPTLVERELTEYATCDLITVPSTFAARSFSISPELSSKVRVLPYGADLTDYYRTQKRDAVFRVLYVGSLTLRKGIPYLLQAVESIRDRRLELVLRGAVSSEIRPILRSTTCPHRLVGPLSREGLRDLFNQASVLVLPSVEDGFGLVIAQAMACGVPVIASANTGGPDLIADGHDGYIVPIRDAAAIAERISRLHDDEELLRSMGEEARKTIVRLGGWQSYGDGVLDCYRHLVSSH